MAQNGVTAGEFTVHAGLPRCEAIQGLREVLPGEVRQHDIQSRAAQLRFRVAEDPLGSRVHAVDPAQRITRQDAFRDVIQNDTQT